MSLNIGRIDFSVDANTRGLQKAAREIKGFRKVVTDAAKSQAQGAKQTANALGIQERKMKAAFQQVKAFQASMKRSGLEAEKVAKRMKPVESALNRYIKELKSGKLSTVEMGRATDGFANKLNRAKRSFSSYNVEVKRGDHSRLVRAFRNLESASVLAVGPLSVLGARIRSIGAIAGRSSLGLTAFVAGITAGAVALGKLIAAGVRANIQLEQSSARFKSVASSVQLADKEMQFAIKLANKYGLEINATARSYSRFLASIKDTTLEGQKGREVFDNVSRAIAGMRLSAAEAEGIFRALIQIISKGTVSTEEIKQQMGDQLPGALNLAAKSADKTTRAFLRLVEQGEVLSDTFVPGFAETLAKELGSKAEDNVNSLTGSFTRMRNEFNLLAAQMDDTFIVTQSLVGVMKQTGDLLNFLRGGDDVKEGLTDPLLELEETMIRLKRESDELKQKFSGTFTEGFIKVGESLTEVVTKLDEYRLAAKLMSREGVTVTQALSRVQIQAQLTSAKEQDLITLSWELGRVLGRGVAPNAEAVAKALAEANGVLTATVDGYKQADIAAKAFKNSQQQLLDLQARINALRTGDEAVVATYDKITAKAEVWARQLAEVTGESERITEFKARYIALLTEQAALEQGMSDAAKKQADDTRRAAQEARELAQALERASNAAHKAQLTINLMKGRVEAMARGPESLRIFEQVDRPLEVFKEHLREAGVHQEKINRLAREYHALLVQQALLTGPVAEGFDAIAQASGNALEDALRRSSSLKDIMHSLAEEIWLVVARLLLIQPVVDAISTSLKNSFAQGAQGGGGFGGILASIFGNIGNLSQGGVGGAAIPSSGGGGFSGFGGGLADGGFVNPRKLHPVVERNEPELLYARGRTYLMSPGGGRVEPLTEGAGGGSVNVTSHVHLPPERRRYTAQQTAVEVSRNMRRDVARNT